MIPFENTCPYENVGGDLYVNACPFCGEEQVLLPLKPSQLREIREGKRHLLVMPCCHEDVKLVDADDDYLLADRSIR